MRESLKHELNENKIFLGKLGKLYPKFYKILDDIIYMHPHEKRFFGFGVIFSDKPIPINHEKTNIFIPELTDGKKVFGFIKLKNKTEYTLLLKDQYIGDLELVSICSNNKTCIILRSNEIIKIYYWGNIYINENRMWRKIEKRSLIQDRLVRHYPDINSDLFSKLLDMAYYDLSINKIGATIVYWIGNKPNRKIAINEKMNIDFISDLGKVIIRNYIEKNDGAILINDKGMILGGKIHLQYTERSSVVNSENKGTRHTSAKRFSYEYPRTIIITVSEDGPVSIFSNGANIITINQTDLNVNYNISNTASQFGKNSDYGMNQVVCQKCSTPYMISWSIVSGDNEPLEEKCSVCGSVIYSMDCFQLDSLLLKKI